jgi:hypothetical protein
MYWHFFRYTVDIEEVFTSIRNGRGDYYPHGVCIDRPDGHAVAYTAKRYHPKIYRDRATDVLSSSITTSAL